jgi:hypothetical protein
MGKSNRNKSSGPEGQALEQEKLQDLENQSGGINGLLPDQLPARQLEQWLGELADIQPTTWAQLPDIGLYMDQVQTWVERQLHVYRHGDKDRLLTPAMVNNYIKDDLMPRADGKKYAPTHLALLSMIGVLKQVLSMADLKALLGDCRTVDQVEPLYASFQANKQKALHDHAAAILARTADLPESAEAQKEALRQLALEWAVEARIRILLAEKMLALL